MDQTFNLSHSVIQDSEQGLNRTWNETAGPYSDGAISLADPVDLGLCDLL